MLRAPWTSLFRILPVSLHVVQHRKRRLGPSWRIVSPVVHRQRAVPSTEPRRCLWQTPCSVPTSAPGARRAAHTPESLLRRCPERAAAPAAGAFRRLRWSRRREHENIEQRPVSRLDAQVGRCENWWRRRVPPCNTTSCRSRGTACSHRRTQFAIRDRRVGSRIIPTAVRSTGLRPLPRIRRTNTCSMRRRLSSRSRSRSRSRV